MRALAFTIVALLGGELRAEPTDDPIALALFTEGKELADRGDLEHACPKFEAAHARALWIGIDLNLADCFERTNRTASAWAMFRMASDAADKAGDGRAAYAHERADRLVPLLPHVEIDAVDGSQVTLDGKPLLRGELGIALPLDPGSHVVAARAPGRISWSRTIEVTASATEKVHIPSLEVAPVPLVVPVAPGASTETTVVRHHARLALGLGVGGATAIVGAVIVGIDAKHRFDLAKAVGHCDTTLVCDPITYDAITSARTRGDVASVLGAAGFAAVGAAIIMYVTGREHALVPVVTSSTIGVRGSL